VKARRRTTPDAAEFADTSITALQPTRDSGERLKVRVGRRVLGVLRAGDVADLGLRVGTVLSETNLKSIVERSQFVAALDAALRRLKHCARSETEMRSHLHSRGYEAAHIAMVIERLSELKLLDDREFAREALSQTTRRAPAGARLLRDVLDRHGVKPEIAGEAIEEARAESPHEEQQARGLIESRLKAMGSLDPVAKARRLMGLLARRGFEQELAERLIREIVGLDD